MSFDSFDQAILAIVRDDNRITYDALGVRVGLSPSSCRRRLAALRKSGVIIADVAIIDPRKIGKVSLYALVTLERDTIDDHRAFRKQVAETTEIISCHYITGSADYLLTIETNTMDKYDDLMDIMMSRLSINKMQTMVSMKSIKRW